MHSSFFLFFLFPLRTKCHGIYKLHKTIHVVRMIISYSKTNENDVSQVREVINRQPTSLWKSGLASQYSLLHPTVSQDVRSKAPQKIFAPGFQGCLILAIVFSPYLLPDHEVAKNYNDHILSLNLMIFFLGLLESLV